MWSAYRDWFDAYDASPKIKIDLQTFDLEQNKNQEVILQQIDQADRTSVV